MSKDLPQRGYPQPEVSLFSEPKMHRYTSTDMIKIKTSIECITFFVVVALGFSGLQYLQQVSAEETISLLGDAPSDISNAIAQSNTMCTLGAVDYLEYLENADDQAAVLFAGCGGLF